MMGAYCYAELGTMMVRRFVEDNTVCANQRSANSPEFYMVHWPNLANMLDFVRLSSLCAYENILFCSGADYAYIFEGKNHFYVPRLVFMEFFVSSGALPGFHPTVGGMFGDSTRSVFLLASQIIKARHKFPGADMLNLLVYLFAGCQTIVALTFGEYILKPFYPDCAPPQAPVIMLAAVCICKPVIQEKCHYFTFQ
jgi:hypothetical protein